MGVRAADRTLLLASAGQYLIGRDDGSTFVTGDTEYEYLKAGGFLKEAVGIPKGNQSDVYGPMKYPIITEALLSGDGVDITAAQRLADALEVATPKDYRVGAEEIWAAFLPKNANGGAVWVVER